MSCSNILLLLRGKIEGLFNPCDILNYGHLTLSTLPEPDIRRNIRPLRSCRNGHATFLENTPSPIMQQTVRLLLTAPLHHKPTNL